MILYVPWHQPQDARRCTEYQHVLSNNLRCGMFDEVRLLLEEDVYSVPSDLHLCLIPLGKRCTYHDIFDHARRTVPVGQLVVMANADIIFDESLAMLNGVNNMDQFFVALTRHTISTTGWTLDPVGHWGQDAWAWVNPLRPLGQEDFPFGFWGSENRLAYEADKAGYAVLNPSKTIKIKHWHFSNVRTTSGREDNRIHGQYVLPEPQHLEEKMEPGLVVEM